MKTFRVCHFYFPFVIFLFPIFLQAQADCEDIQLIAVKDFVSDPADLGCGSGGEDCFRVSVPIYFKHDDPSPAADFFACEITITGTVSGGIGVSINEDLTEDCNGLFAFNNTGNSFTYTVTDETIDFTDQNDPNFTLFLNARPGEEFNLDITSVEMDINGTCDECDLSEASPIQIIDFDGQGDALTKNTPSSCSQNEVEFELAAEILDGTFSYISLYLNHNVSCCMEEITLEDYDLVIIVNDVYENLQSVEFNDLGTNNFEVEDIITDGSEYQIYLSSTGVSNSLTDGFEMGRIRLNHPTSDDQEVQVEAHFDYARVNYSADTDAECCSPDLSHETGSELVALLNEGHPNCSDLSVNSVFSNSNTTSSDCDIFEYEIFLTPTTSDTFDQVVLEAEFDFNGSVTITDVDISELGACPSNVCITDCYSIMSGNTVEYGFCALGGLILNSEVGIAITLEGTSGACVEGVSFTRTLFNDGTACSAVYTNNEAEKCFRSISGIIETEVGVEAVNTDVVFENVTEEEDCFTLSEATNPCGSVYSVCSHSICENADEIRVVPSNNTLLLCGITTLDMVLITKHILGLEFLDSPYKIIAADANKSNSVTTLDLVELRKLILQISQELPNGNTSWRFVDENFVFPNQTNPWVTQFPESVLLDDPPFGFETADFVAIKIGDVNLTCNSCDAELVNEIPDSTVLAVKAGDAAYGQNDTVSVVFQTDGDYELAAYQIGLTFDPGKLSYLETICGQVSGLVDIQCSVDSTQGEVRLLSYSPNADNRSFTDSTTLFTLKFIAQDSLTTLSSIITMDTSVLHCMGYDTSGTHFAMSFEFVDHSEIRSLIDIRPDFLLRVYPNPTESIVTFEVGDFPGGVYMLRIIDLKGQIMYEKSGTREMGSQSWILESVDQLASGCYFIQLVTEKGHQIKRFIKS